MLENTNYERWQGVGIEKDEEYFRIAINRIQ